MKKVAALQVAMLLRLPGTWLMMRMPLRVTTFPATSPVP